MMIIDKGITQQAFVCGEGGVVVLLTIYCLLLL